MKYKVTGKQKEVVRKIEGESYVEIGMFRLWFSNTGLSILTSRGGVFPSAWSSNYIYRNGDVKDDIREVLKESIRQVEAFDREKALAELKEALTRVDEIAELAMGK